MTTSLKSPRCWGQILIVQEQYLLALLLFWPRFNFFDRPKFIPTTDRPEHQRGFVVCSIIAMILDISERTVWLIRYTFLVVFFAKCIWFLTFIYSKSPKSKRRSLHFVLCISLLVITACYNVFLIIQEVSWLLEFRLALIPAATVQVLLAGAEVIIGEFCLCWNFRARIAIRRIIWTIMITRTILQTVFIILYLVTLGTGNFSRYRSEMEVLSLTLGVLLTTNGVIMSVSFFFRYRAKIKYAIAKRKLLKLLFRQCFPYGLLATLLLIPVSVSFFVTRLIMVNAYTFDTLVYYLVRQFLRFLWTFSICYAMYLVNLGSQHINPMSYDGDNKLDDAVEIVSAFRHDREQRSIVEMFLRQVFHRFGGGVQGYILNYTNEGEQRISPVCKFTLTEKGEIENITFISNDTFLSPTDLALPLVHSAIARKETFLMSFDDCLEDEEIRSKCDVSRFRTGGGSVVCVPIMDQEILSSVVYFESTKDVLIDTISPVDLYILELLSQQLNISLENSRLFADLTTMNRSLDRKVEERTRELKQQKVELEEAKCKAEASAQSKLIFLANMSHEVRTPASQILSSAEVLSKTSLTGEQSEYLNIIQSSGKLLLHILNDILDISKLNSQKLKLEFAEFNMHQAIKSTIGAFSVSKPVSVAYFIDESLPQIAVGDVTRIQQIFTNLVSNAVKFTDVGYVLLSTHAVLVESAQDQNIFDITCSVSDSGTGISPENVNLIFDRFEQENTSISRTRGGTGLGLAIASDLCRLMGSKLRVETSLGSGSKFYFTLRLPCPKNPTISPRIRHISRLNKSVLLLSNSTVCVRDTNKTVIRLQLEHLGLNITRKFWPFENDTTRNLCLDAIVFDACSIPNEQIKDAIWRIQSFGYPLLVIYSQDQSRYFTNASYPTLQHPYKQRCLKFFLYQMLDGGKDIVMNDNERIAPPPSLPEMPQNLSILLAEDNIVNQKVLSAMFKKMGYKIDIAENGQIALDLVKSSTYDIVFMDVRMPQMDGLEATKRIRQFYNELSSKPPVIIGLSADALTENVEAGISAGMNAYLTKPVSMGQLTKVIKQYFT